mgnify:FL=1
MKIWTVYMSTKKVTEQSHKKTTSKDRRESLRLETLEYGRKAYMKGDFDQAMNTWLPLAENGDVEAQAWVGSLYANGDGVKIDPSVAFQWYLRSAKGGNPQAQANVGALYAMGQGVGQDMAEAVRWIRRAARNGDANAQFNMAVLYTKGDGVKQNPTKAAEWYRKGAENGHHQSQGRLGHMYHVGDGVKKDRVEAYLWLSLASQHGIGSALTELEKVIGEMSSDEKAAGMKLVEMWRSQHGSSGGSAVFTPLPE